MPKIYQRIFLFIGIALILLTACTTQSTTSTFVEQEPTPIPKLEKMEMTVLEPRPDFIETVSPPEYYIIPLSLYNHQPEGLAGFRVKNYDTDSPSILDPGYQSAICVHPFAELLVQEGDVFVARNMEGAKIKDRMALLVDGELVEADVQAQDGQTISFVTRVPQSPHTAWIEDADYCWEVPLNVGQHEVTYQFHQTSGDIQAYTWYIEISE